MSFFLDGVNSVINTYPSIAGIMDNFDALALNPAIWDLANSTGYSDDGARCNLNGTSSQLQSFPHWSLPNGAAVFVRAWPDLTSGHSSFFGVQSVLGSYLEFRFTSGTLHFNSGSPSETSSMVYDGTAHAWWRVRRSGAQVAFDTAPQSGNLIGPATWSQRFITTLSPNFLEEQDFYVYAGAA